MADTDADRRSVPVFLHVLIFPVKTEILFLILAQNVFEAVPAVVISGLNNLVCAAEHPIADPSFLSKVHFAPFLANLRERQAIQRCPHIFGQKPLHDPFYENPVNRKESIAIHQVLGGIGRKNLVCIQAIGNMSGKFVIPASVQDVVHQVIHKGNDIPSLIGDKSLPRFRKFSAYILGGVGDEHGNDQLFQRRLDIRVTEVLLTELPEVFQQAVFFHLGQKLVICKLAVCQHDPDHFFKGTGAGAANGRQQPRDDVLFIEVLDFKVIEALCPFLVGKELDIYGRV